MHFLPEKFAVMPKNAYLCNRMTKNHLLHAALLLLLPALLLAKPRCLVVKAGDAASFLAVLEEAGRLNADTASERLYILIPNGYYDLGETVLTPILGHNLSLVGESMEGTIIRNAPPVKDEGISKTATLLNRGVNTFVCDLTLQNDLDYYNSGPAGRAVCWQDKGYRAIFKRVRLLSFQDTYYSNSEECQHYMEDSEIHGTVDFICGAGDVVFNRCLLVTEKCNEANNSSHNIIAAPRTSSTDWGYVFMDCTIRSFVSPFHLGRGWHTHPRCTWLNTRLETPSLLLKERYDPYGIRAVNNEFFEYHTMDAQGNDITPRSNLVTFIHDADTNTVETIIPEAEARRYQIKKIFPDWRPEKMSLKLEREALKLRRRFLH
jgi:hypothetical protein